MLTQAWTPLRYHEKQAHLWRTRARFVAVAAGRGSGKTELARRRVVRMLAVKKAWHNPLYFYALPTYKQARRVAWQNIVALIPPGWLARPVNNSDMMIQSVFGVTLYVVGLDKPQRIEGDQWDGGVIDESCDQRPGAFDRSVLPALSHRNGWCWRIGVPKRVGIGAVEFRNFFENVAEESYAWSSEDILSPEQLRWAQANLDPKDYNEQYRASWEDRSGLVFYAFDDVLNVKDTVCYAPDTRLIVGSDFNVDPMCWVVCQRPRETPWELHVLDEIFARNTNTRATLDALYKKYSEHRAGWEFIGDATGKARKTSASQTDYAQIYNDVRFHDKRVAYPASNPRVTDRFASCNAMFQNAQGVRRCYVHPRCRHLIHDIGARQYKPGTTEPDDHDDLGHMTDALGYVLHTVFPLRAMPQGRAQISMEMTNV